MCSRGKFVEPENGGGSNLKISDVKYTPQDNHSWQTMQNMLSYSEVWVLRIRGMDLSSVSLQTYSLYAGHSPHINVYKSFSLRWQNRKKQNYVPLFPDPCHLYKNESFFTRPSFFQLSPFVEVKSWHFSVTVHQPKLDLGKPASLHACPNHIIVDGHWETLRFYLNDRA